MPAQPAVSFDALLPPQIAEACERVGAAKARMDLVSTLVLAGLAGAFISPRAVLFTGPVTGAELFTGNTLIIMAWASRRVSTPLLLRNWVLVYAGNFVGALLTVLLVYASQQWEFNGDQIGATALKVA